MAHGSDRPSNLTLNNVHHLKNKQLALINEKDNEDEQILPPKIKNEPD